MAASVLRVVVLEELSGEWERRRRVVLSLLSEKAVLVATVISHMGPGPVNIHPFSGRVPWRSCLLYHKLFETMMISNNFNSPLITPPSTYHTLCLVHAYSSQPWTTEERDVWRRKMT